MKLIRWPILLIALSSFTLAGAATRDSDLPDWEMLRMMEFLREMEMIKEMEKIKDWEQAEQIGNRGAPGSGQTPPPAKLKEAAK